MHVLKVIQIVVVEVLGLVAHTPTDQQEFVHKQGSKAQKRVQTVSGEAAHPLTEEITQRVTQLDIIVPADMSAKTPAVVHVNLEI